MHEKTKVFKLNDVYIPFDVRTESRLDQAHIYSLAERLEAGEHLNPILVTMTEDLPHDCPFEKPPRGAVVINGRHTIKAYDLIGTSTIICVVAKYDSFRDMVAAGMHANDYIGLPNTPLDEQDNVTKLMTLGHTKKSIMAAFMSFGYSDKRARNMIAKACARSIDNRTRLGVHRVHAGEPIEKVARDLHLQVPKLKRRLAAPDRYTLAKFQSSMGVILANMVRSVKVELKKTINFAPEEKLEVAKRVKDLEWKVQRSFIGLVDE